MLAAGSTCCLWSGCTSCSCFAVVHRLHADISKARSKSMWGPACMAQVFVHALRKVDMRAMIGQTSTASVVVRGAATSRRVGVYASHPDELQVGCRAGPDFWEVPELDGSNRS